MTFEIGPCYGGILHEKLLLRLTPSKVEDSSTGPAYYINDNGEIVTIPAETAIYIDKKYGNLGSFKQMCRFPYDPASLSTNFVTVVNTGVVLGSFSECSVSDKGATWNAVYLYKSTIGGNPSSKMYITCMYKIGTSGTARIVCRDVTLGLFSDIVNIAGAWVISASDAGTITIKSDFLHPIGFRVLTFEINWLHPSNTLYVELSPYSSNYSNLLLYGASANGLGNIWPFTCPGLTTIASRAGTIFVPMEIGDKLYSLLDGDKNFKLVFKWTPAFSSSDILVSTTGNILHSGTQAILQFRTDAVGNGYIDLKDGTHITTVALDWEYDTHYDIQANIGWNESESADKMQLIVDSTASTLSAFDGSLDPDTEMTIGYNNDYMFKITPPKFYTLKQSDWR